MTADPAYVTVTLPSGASYELSIAAGDRDIYHSAVAAQSAYDENWHFLNAWTRPGDVFFDLGANIGTITIPAAINGAKVHAFELLDANVQHIVKSVERNALSSVSIVLGALSDHEGLAAFAGYSAWGEVVKVALVSIPTVVIDNYVQNRSVSLVNTMKIDIEGSELAALRGACRLIDRDHPDIVIECNALTCSNQGYSYRDLLRFLEENAYNLYRLHDRRLCPWRAEQVQEVICTDYFATVKTAAMITARSGWPIADLTSEETIENIACQDLYGDDHKQFVLAIENTLPPAIRFDPRISALLAKWQEISDANSIAVMKIGAA